MPPTNESKYTRMNQGRQPLKIFTLSILEHFVPNVNVQRVIKIVSMCPLHLLSTLSSSIPSLNGGIMHCIEPAELFIRFLEPIFLTL